MIDGTPRHGGEFPLDIPRDLLLTAAFENTPLAAEAFGAVEGSLQEENAHLAMLAGANLYHAERLEAGARMSDREQFMLHGLLTGRPTGQIVGEAWAAGFDSVQPGSVRHQAEVAGQAVRGSLRLVTRTVDQPTLDQVTRYMQLRTEELMGSTAYDRRNLHEAVRWLARTTSTHQADTESVARETQSLLHHFSDSELAPPATVSSRNLTVGLTALRNQYQRWVRQIKLPEADASYQMMEELLSLSGRRIPQSFRQLLARHPERVDELRRQLTEHLEELFLTSATLPPVRQEPEQQAAHHPERKPRVRKAAPAAVTASRAPAVRKSAPRKAQKAPAKNPLRQKRTRASSLIWPRPRP